MNKYYKKQLKHLHKELRRLREQVVQDAGKRLEPYRACYSKKKFNKSACNLAYYLAIRRHDLRPLQEKLAEIGLSSLGRGEAHLMANLEHVIQLVAGLLNEEVEPVKDPCPHLAYSEGDKLLSRHTSKLLGPTPAGRDTRIMVTLSTELADDYPGMLALLEQGMDCVRINCAHDDADTWRRMVENVRRAEQESSRSCRILMDLAGHKIRTGELAQAAPVRHLKPEKDIFGKPVKPCEVLLLDETMPLVEGFDTRRQFHIPAPLHACMQVDDHLGFHDARGKSRRLEIVSRNADGTWLAHLHQSSYLLSGSTLRWLRADSDGAYTQQGDYALGEFSGAPMKIRLHLEDRLHLTRQPVPAQPGDRDAQRPALIACTMPAIIDDLKVGEPVWINDGMIGLEVEQLTEHGALLQVKHCDPAGAWLRADKGINCPATRFSLPPLSDKDLSDLDFVCKHADMVGFSFVESLQDMRELSKELKKRGAGKLPIIAKIETDAAVHNLPDILLGSMGRQSMGVMIARGDLSVELGSVRLTEIQEEILWLCEAAHVPVIWATQVLETIVKRGVRSRPEFTDAAMGVRAECVMLNKGPYIRDAVVALSNVLSRMREHQHKKFSRLRALHW